MRTTTRSFLVLITAVLSIAGLPACHMFSDPATRLAYCLEEGVKKPQDAVTSIQVNCDLKVSGNYVVLLHPAGEKSDDELVADGVPAAVIPALRVLRIGDRPSIYVIATNKQTPDSRTTYQNNFIRIDRVLVAAKSAQPLTVDITGTAGERAIQSIR